LKGNGCPEKAFKFIAFGHRCILEQEMLVEEKKIGKPRASCNS
jgi:hypothetical protein